MPRARRRGVLAAGCAVALVLAAPALRAQSSPEEAPPPDSAGGLSTAIEANLAHDTTQAELTARERRSRRNMGVWLLESVLTAQLRTFIRDIDRFNGQTAGATAVGGWVRFRSGRWHDNFAFRAALYMSLRVHADPGNTGPTQILAPDDGNLVSLGVLNAEAYWKRNIFTVGAQDLNYPLVGKSDTRMIPRSFLSATGQGPLGGDWQWIGGYITRMKERDADRFVAMSRIADTSLRVNRGMIAAGVRRTGSNHRLTSGLFNYYVPDLHNMLYGEVSVIAARGANSQLGVDVQFNDQRTVGDGLLAGSPYDTRYFGARVSGSYNSWVFALAGSAVAEGGEIVAPYGLFPGYTSLMNNDFSRAGETGWAITGSKVLHHVVNGLSVFVGYGRGTGGLDASSATRPVRDMVEVTFDYRPTSGPLDGFWFRIRGMKAWQHGPLPNGHDLRIIGYYDIPIPWPPRGPQPATPARR